MARVAGGQTGHANIQEMMDTAWKMWVAVTGVSQWETLVSKKDADFVESIGLDMIGPAAGITPRQYFWLKDIYDRLVEDGEI